ncbi:MAG: HAD-IC family P-type ATPase [Deltaproteobacteria bacterium]|nr:HAD-IC family P-type ATPase [Deltaproteobacteria bacterium]
MSNTHDEIVHPFANGSSVDSDASSRPWHALDREAVAAQLGVAMTGLSDHEAAERLERYGRNRIEPTAPTARWKILARQFRSPLIYVLLVAGAVALLLGEIADAIFIAAVLLLNAFIGFVNEYRADREVYSLATLVTSRARVQRDGRIVDVDTECIVPGDLLVLEGGVRIGADLRLVEEHDLRVDESLLSGESLPVQKDASITLPVDTPLSDRRNMVFAGSMATSGRALGLAVATGGRTELGAIATQLESVPHESPPLVQRMELFARRIGTAALVLCVVLVMVGTARGQPLAEVLLVAIALAVSAIPEGLPVALNVALAVAVSRMAKRGVVVRHLPAVEALGSCGVIGTDKTGTLTRNQLTVERVLCGALRCDVTGVGYVPEGEVTCGGRPVIVPEQQRLFRIARAVCLANEASLTQRQNGTPQWEWSGDPTDIALLAFAIKLGLDPASLVEAHEPVGAIPFESEHRYMASFHRFDGGGLVCVKGAPERVIEMCDREPADTADGFVPTRGSPGSARSRRAGDARGVSRVGGRGSANSEPRVIAAGAAGAIGPGLSGTRGDDRSPTRAGSRCPRGLSASWNPRGHDYGRPSNHCSDCGSARWNGRTGCGSAHRSRIVAPRRRRTRRTHRKNRGRRTGHAGREAPRRRVPHAQG